MSGTRPKAWVDGALQFEVMGGGPLAIKEVICQDAGGFLDSFYSINAIY